jgi:SAM-dependent methyltransferase
MTTQSDAAQRAEWLRLQREGWSAAAPSWDEWFDAFEEFAAPLTLELLARCGAVAGARVLDVGCGNGVPAISAARSVGAKGRVVGIDLAEPMIEHAHKRAAAVGAPNVEFLARSAEVLAGLGPFDAAYSRFALMLVPDPVAAARAIRDVLRPGGRLAACVWGGEGEVPFCSIVPYVLRDTLDVAPPQPDAPGPLRLGRPGQLVDVLRAAGFVDVTEVTRRVEPRFASVADAARFYCEGSGSVRRALGGHGAEARARFVAGFERALTAYRRDDGSVVMPSTVRIASGSVG